MSISGSLTAAACISYPSLPDAKFATDTGLNLPSDVYGWTLVRDPLLTVPLAGNPAFEALKREIDPPN